MGADRTGAAAPTSLNSAVAFHYFQTRGKLTGSAKLLQSLLDQQNCAPAAQAAVIYPAFKSDVNGAVTWQTWVRGLKCRSTNTNDIKQKRETALLRFLLLLWCAETRWLPATSSLQKHHERPSTYDCGLSLHVWIRAFQLLIIDCIGNSSPGSGLVNRVFFRFIRIYCLIPDVYLHRLTKPGVTEKRNHRPDRCKAVPALWLLFPSFIKSQMNVRESNLTCNEMLGWNSADDRAGWWLDCPIISPCPMISSPQGRLSEPILEFSRDCRVPSRLVGVQIR